MEYMLKSGLSQQPTDYCSVPLHLNPGFPDPRQRKDDMLPTRNVAALTLNHLPVLYPAKVSLLEDVRENLATHLGKAVPIPTIYNAILIAPPIVLEDKLQLRGGTSRVPAP